MSSSWGIVCAVSLFFSVTSSVAHAQSGSESPSESADYKDIVNRAVEAFEAEDYARARGLFEQAQALKPNARVLRGLGISALNLKRFTDAKRELSQSLTETRQALNSTQRTEVTNLLSWIQTELSTLRLSLQPTDALVELDGAGITDKELVTTPGMHRVSVHAADFQPEMRVVDLTAGRELTLTVKLSPKPVEPPAKPALSAEVAAAAAIPAPESATPLQPVGADPVDRDRGESSSVFGQWWFWTAVGVVIAGGVATGLVLTQHSPGTKSYAQGGLGGVLMPLHVETNR